jgi:hypothetical protein
MTQVTLKDLFRDLDGEYYENRQAFEEAVVEVFNRHVAELPVGYSYEDAIEGARVEGWLKTNGGGHGVQVSLSQPVAA